MSESGQERRISSKTAMSARPPIASGPVRRENRRYGPLSHIGKTVEFSPTEMLHVTANKLTFVRNNRGLMSDFARWAQRKKAASRDDGRAHHCRIHLQMGGLDAQNNALFRGHSDSAA